MSIGTVAKLLILAFVIHTFVLPQLGGARAALKTVSSVSPVLVVLALGLEAGSLVAYGALTQTLLPARPRLSLGFCTGAALASTGINHVIPGGAATTATVNYRIFGRAGVPGPELAFVLGTEAIGSAVVLNILLWLALLWSIPASGLHPLYATAAAVGAVLMIGMAAGVVALIHGREWLAVTVARAAGHLPRVRGESVEHAIRQAGVQLDLLIHTEGRLWRAGGLAALNWLLDAAALWTMVSAFGHRPGVVGVLVAYGLANVMAALPFSPGGLGIVEAVLIPSLIGFGTPAPVAAVAVVGYRLISFWLPIPLGLGSFLFLMRRSTPEEPSPQLGKTLDEMLKIQVEHSRQHPAP